ncbi:serine protease [Skermanella stibiiresistens SB22]|uniref:Serine protease n=1 Tax=Skermanella stibiiresistens SB22 TaxID=1385369 RepID=W9H1B6_9PROT|nr:serine protease [Skermanella stibiiresistens SB22]
MPDSRQQISLSFAPLVKQTAPAVVNIYTRRVIQQRASPLFDDPFFQRFFGQSAPRGLPRERVERSLGSGVIVAPDGLIVTNDHVVKDSDQITVVLADRREFEARVVSTDGKTDLAILRITPPRGERLPFLALHDSDELEVGDLVLAIGNPFGVGQTVTSGIVSALARTAVGVSDFNFFIQTDAAINPGNSGGALVAMDGRLVGINSAIYSRSGGSIGIGFAIPSNMVRTVIDAVNSGGKLVRPWLGIDGQQVTGDIASSLGLARPAGVLVNAIDPKSPAAQAGLRVGDVISAINGREVDDPDSLRFRVATLPVGSQVALTVARRGTNQSVAFKAIAPPENPPRDTTPLGGRQPLAGATVANLSPALAEEIGFSGVAQGVVILEVARNSPAARVGVEPGDVVLRIDEREVSSVSQLGRLIARPQQTWKVTVRRGDKVLTSTVAG